MATYYFESVADAHYMQFHFGVEYEEQGMTDKCFPISEDSVRQLFQPQAGDLALLAGGRIASYEERSKSWWIRKEDGRSPVWTNKPVERIIQRQGKAFVHPSLKP